MNKNEEKIFTRRKIRLPKFRRLVGDRRLSDKKRKLIKIMAVLIIAITFSYTVTKAIEPIIETQCRNLAKNVATKVSNEEATNVMADYEYEELVNVIKDENDNIKMLSTNIIVINKIISDIPIKIEEALKKEENSEFNIKLSTFLGSKLLGGRGPNINVKLQLSGNVETNLKSEFISTGINQTLHRIYLEVRCNVTILTPYDTIKETIVNQVLLVEGVIIGNIPDTYYNLEGLDGSQSMEMID